jgi:predicted acetylornithine/succinylornithine family transaminase
MSQSESIAGVFNKHVMPTYAPGLTLVKGQGARVWDADGKVYLDFTSGISVLNVGHCNPRVVEAIRKQSEKLMHVSNLFYTENQALLAERLTGLALGGKAFFCNSGAEANEGLFKLARLWGHAEGRHEIICMQNSFHGRTLATAAATGQEKVKKGFDPLPEGFVHATFNDLDSVKALVNEKTVAIHLEPILGEGGVVPADEAFIKGVRELCDSKNLLMLCDEVQCGMGRTGNWFGFQGYDVTPDAIALAKALGNGFPIGAILSGERLADVFQPGNHASTFGGTPLACAAALATIDVIEGERLGPRAAVKGEEFKGKLLEFVERYEHVTDVRGAGLMLGIVLDGPAQPLVDLLTDMGLLTIATAQNVVRLLPPLNTRDDELDEAFDMIEDCLDEWHGLGEAQAEDETEVAASEEVAAAAATDEAS